MINLELSLVAFLPPAVIVVKFNMEQYKIAFVLYNCYLSVPFYDNTDE